MAKNVLGRGLGALIQARPAGAGTGGKGTGITSVSPVPAPGETVRKLPLDQIRSSPYQPRKDFKPESLKELVDSIKEQGIIQPLIVRKVGDTYELIAGERRWRAAKALELTEAPAIVREASDQEVLELALIENIQRADLNVIEEAHAYNRLASEFNLRQEDIARKVGKSRAAVANAMRLLDLDGQVQRWLTEERLSVGHAKVLLGIKVAGEQQAIAEHIIRQRSTVRAAEKLVSDHNTRQGNTATGPGSRAGSAARALGEQTAEIPPVLQHWQNRLRDRLATHVVLRHGEKKGSIEIEYYGNDDLRRVLDALGVKTDDV